jgi:heme-degrading monooxygenase HmoA
MTMYAVIFEVYPKPDRQQEYLDIATALRPALDGIDGFISIERFASMHTQGKLLSLSYWKDENALSMWREHSLHRDAQQ